MISFSEPYRIVIVFAICCSALVQEVRPAGSQLSEEKLREVAKLRAELTEAFDEHEEAAVAAKGVVVQPTWLKEDDQGQDKARARPKGAAKDAVTDADLEEARRLREEIARAVAADVYAAGSGAGDAKDVQRLEKSFGLKQHSKGVLQGMVGAEQADPTSAEASAEEAEAEAESVGAVDELDEAGGGDGPNVVESSAALEPADLDVRKLQRLEVAKRRTKEVLVLTAIEEDLEFTLGDDVVEWAHIRHDGRAFFVGRRAHDLVVVEEEPAAAVGVGAGALRYGQGAVLEVGRAIACLETYSHWDAGRQRQEGVLLVAADGDLVRWYRGLDLYWEWRTGRAVAGLTYFRIEASEYLAVASNEASRAGLYALNIYQFELQAQEFWIVQRLQLRHPCGAVAVLDTGRDIVLAVAQNRSAAHVYAFNPREHAAASEAGAGPEHVRFQLRRRIESEGVESVAAFEMGGRNYLAVGGEQAQILLYQQGEFVPKTVFGENFGRVELFLPVPVHTYRDDLILLVQHRVDFSTHGLTVLETLVWNGEAFEAGIPVPCRLGPHTVYGASCLLDPQRDAGLRGAALLRRGDEVGLIVPRHEAESGLFRLHTELLARNSELLDLQEIFAFLQDWVREQDELVAQARDFVDEGSADGPAPPDLSELEELRTPELRLLGDVGEIHVNEHRWTDEDAAVDLDALMQAIEELGQQLLGGLDTDGGGRRRRELAELTLDSLELDALEAEELLLELVNGERFYVRDGALDLAGVLNLASLEVLEPPASGGRTLEVDGDLQFEEINGVPWHELRQGLVFRNHHVRLDELDVKGEVVVEERLWTDRLNSLAFPEDFLWSSGPSTSVVRAEKTFLGTLASDAVDTGGPINGVDPFDAITLAEPQEWTGATTFARLEVSERLELLGSAKGRGLEDFEANPTLLESRVLEAACRFAQLEVRGPVLVRGEFEGRRLSPLLADIVQRPTDPDQDEIRVSAPKNFSAVHFPVDLRVGDGRVNDIPVGDFVPSHTRQELELAALPAYVYFHNLTLGGAFDGVDVSELLERAIHIDGSSTEAEVELGSTQLNFAQAVVAERVEVRRTLNGVAIAEGFQTLLEDLKVHELHLDELGARVGDVASDVRGDGTLNGLRLRDFLEPRTWSEPAASPGNIFLDELNLVGDGGLQADAMHGIDAEFLLGFLERIDDVPEMILDGKIQVDHVLVSGDVQVNQLNGHRFDEDVQLTAVWLDRPNYLSTRLRFEEPVLLRGPAFCEGALNAWPSLPDLLDDVAFRTNDSASGLRVAAPKSFAKDVEVRGDARVAALNGLAFDRIATTRRPTAFAGSLRVHGDVAVRELVAAGSLNDSPLAALGRRLRFDPDLGAFVLRGEVALLAALRLEDLTVRRCLNEFADLDAFFAQLVFRHEQCLLRGRTTFTGRVSIEGGAYVRSLNGRNLLDLLENVVFVGEPQPVVVRAPLVFADAVRMRDVAVREALTASNLDGCSLSDWLEDTLRVDRDEQVQGAVRFGDGALDGTALFAGSLNEVDLAQVVTLHTPQNLSAARLVISELHLDGAVVGAAPVNGVDLLAEFRNTLLTHGDQHVTSALTMQSCRVLGALETRAPVNGGAKDLRQLATLRNAAQDLEFRSPLFLQNLTARHLLTKDLVSGVHLEHWMKTSLWTRGRSQQWVAGNWSARQLTVRGGGGGRGPPDDDPTLADDAARAAPRPSRDLKAFRELCQRVAARLRRREQRIGFVKYLEEAVELELQLEPEPEPAADPGPIRRALPLAANGTTAFLLLNTGCHSLLYRWDRSRGRFARFSAFESGPVDQVVLMPAQGDGTLRFVANAEASDAFNCSLAGLRAWSVAPAAEARSQHLGDGVSRIHPSARSSRHFYALDEGQRRVVEYALEAGAVVADSWPLPRTQKDEVGDSFRFLPAEGARPTAVSDGRQLLLLQPSDERAKRAPGPASYRARLPFFTPLASPTRSVSESVLKPQDSNANGTTPQRRLTFGDFRQLVERILDDLVYRLHLEVNVTQLSIPESDLYDEHLVPDFIAVMEELQRQELFPPDAFADVSLESLRVPASPAQVLAARAVQIIWPVVVEIEEVHGYLRDNETHAHPVCACITASLGAAIRDVLLLANHPRESESEPAAKDDPMADLTRVIERIRLFQGHLQELARQLEADIKDELPPDPEDPLVAAPAQTRLDMARPPPAVPAGLRGEVVSLEVGPTKEPRPLTAVAYAPASSSQLLADGRHASVRLYLDPRDEASLFQTLPAHRPHGLVALRIGDETLLAFVEDAAELRVLVYRGVQGFVDLVRVRLAGRGGGDGDGEAATTEEVDEVRHLVALSLPSGPGGAERRHFVAAAVGRRLRFFEVQMAGDRTALPAVDCD